MPARPRRRTTSGMQVRLSFPRLTACRRPSSRGGGLPLVSNPEAGGRDWSDGKGGDALRVLVKEHAALRRVCERIVAAADEARRRIERDLHDGTEQQLVS